MFSPGIDAANSAFAAAASFVIAVYPIIAAVARPSTPIKAVMPCTSAGFASMNSATGCRRLVRPSATDAIMGVIASPMEIFTLFAAFCSMVSLASVVLYITPAFSPKAVFFSHALFAWLIVFDSRSPADARPRMAFVCRTFLIPSSSRMTTALLPLRSVSFSPWMNLFIVPTASSPQDCLNCSALIPATEANSSSLFPVSVALYRVVIRVDMDVDPEAASIPREPTAAAMARMSRSLMPACEAAAAMPWDISTTLEAVVAVESPRAATVEPRRS